MLPEEFDEKFVLVRNQNQDKWQTSSEMQPWTSGTVTQGAKLSRTAYSLTHIKFSLLQSQYIAVNSIVRKHSLKNIIRSQKTLEYPQRGNKTKYSVEL